MEGKKDMGMLPGGGACWNVWVLAFMQKIQDTSPGDFESTLIKSGVSGTKEGLKMKETRSQP